MKDNGRKQINEANVLAAVNEGACSLTQVVHALGYSSVCSATTSKIKAAVSGSDIQVLLKANREDPRWNPVEKVVEAVAKPVAKAAEVKEVPQAEVKEVPQADAKGVRHVEAKDGNPYRGILTHAVFEVASQTELAIAECDRRVQEVLASKGVEKPLSSIKFVRAWLSNDNHRSNKTKTHQHGRSKNVSGKRGFVLLQALPATA